MNRDGNVREPRSIAPRDAPAPGGERIAKVLARSGICSRREAERMISDGRVAVNGTVLSSPAVNITMNDVITVDGDKVPPAEPTRLWRFHKAPGTITASHDPQGRPTVFERLPEDMPRMICVGRLDFNTEGLLLMTNDGELARHLELPGNAWRRRYRVKVNGRIDRRKLRSVAGGVTIDGTRYGPIRIDVEADEGENHWLSVTIHEGKNREVRNVMAHLGLKVARLIRVEHGPFSLGRLSRGAIEEVPQQALRKSLKGFFDGR